MTRQVRLSPKHGLNVTIPHCFYCGQAKNEIILAGHLPKDEVAPKNMVWDKVPCDKCKEYMEIGIILISVKDGEKGENPFRTGKFVVIKEEAFTNIFGSTNSRVAFVEDEVWTKVGLPC